MRRLNLFAENAALAVSCLCAGILTIVVSPIGGFANPVWPPAGIALGALLGRGNRLLPGVFIGTAGTALFNLIRVASGTPNVLLVSLAFVMAMAATIQAWLGATVIRRFIGSPLHLGTIYAVTSFLLVAGSLCCLLSASVGTGSLLAAGLLDRRDFGTIWMTWWLGDSMGAIAFTPVVTALFAGPNECLSVHGRAVVVSMIMSVATVMGGFYFGQAFERANVLTNLTVEADSLRADVRDGIAHYVTALDAFAAFQMEAGVDPGSADLIAFAKALLPQYPGIVGMAWYPAAFRSAQFLWPPEKASLFKNSAERLGTSSWIEVRDLAQIRDQVVGTGFVRMTNELQGGFGFFMVRRVVAPRNEVPGYFVALVSPTVMMREILADSAKLEYLAVRVLNREGQPVFEANLDRPGSFPYPVERREANAAPGVEFAVEIGAGAHYLTRFPHWQPTSLLLLGYAFSMISCGFILFMVGHSQVLAREVFEKQRVWDDLLRTEERKAAALEASLDAIVGMDQGGRIIDFNKSAEKLFGHKAADVVGKPLGDVLIPLQFREAHAIGLKRYLETGVGPVLGLTIVVNALHADGHEFPVELQVVAVTRKNESIFTGAVRDISLRKHLEESLKKAKESAEAANAAKSQFLANMSHEIRTPLGAVIGFSDLLGQPGLTPEDRDAYVAAIRRNGALLSNIINDILDLSKVEAGRLDIEIRPTDLRTILRDLETSLSVKAREKGIRFHVECQQDVPDTVQTDPLRLHQILLNIAGNAVKFTRQGEVEVKAGIFESRTESGAGIPMLTFSVRDTGPGLTPEHVQRIFRPFGQADLSTTRKYGGTGLGLVLAKKLANLLGGDVVLTSTTPGQGSVFTITIAAAGGVAAARKVS